MGGGSKSKAPPAPDYSALMQQQFAQNQQLYSQQLSTIQQQIADATQANRATQVGPGGTLSWSQDPNTKQWTQTTTLSPQEQQLYNQQLANQATGQNVQQTALGQLQALQAQGGPNLPGITAQYDQNWANNYANQMEQTLTARLQPQYQQQQEQMDAKLRMQGLQPGTDAYNYAYQNMLKSQGDVISQANLQAQLAGQSEARNQYSTELQGQQAAQTAAMQSYLLPWQTASMGAGLAGNVSMPQFGSYSQQQFAAPNQAQGTDIVGAAQQQYAQQVQNYNQSQQQSSGKGQSLGSVAGGVAGSMFGGPLGGMAGSAIGGAAGGALFSDERLKDAIEPMSDEEAFAKLMEIVPIRWHWKDSDLPDSGVSAQEISSKLPQLAFLAENGYLKVNYTGVVALLLGAFHHLAKQTEVV